MSKWIRKLFETLGLKRKLSAFFAALTPILQAEPSLSFLIPYLDWLAGIFGIAGLGHAAQGKVLKEVPAASLASVFSILLMLTHIVPSLQPYQEVIRLVAAALGVTAVLGGASTSEIDSEVRERIAKNYQ